MYPTVKICIHLIPFFALTEVSIHHLQQSAVYPDFQLIKAGVYLHGGGKTLSCVLAGALERLDIEVNLWEGCQGCQVG